MKISKKILLATLLGISVESYASDFDFLSAEDQDAIMAALSLGNNVIEEKVSDEQPKISLQKSLQIKEVFNDLIVQCEEDALHSLNLTGKLHDKKNDFNSKALKEATFEIAFGRLCAVFINTDPNLMLDLLTEEKDSQKPIEAAKEVKPLEEIKLEESEEFEANEAEEFEVNSGMLAEFGKACRKIEKDIVNETLEKILKLGVSEGGLENLKITHKAWKKQEQHNPELDDYRVFKNLYEEMEVKLSEEKRITRIQDKMKNYTLEQVKKIYDTIMGV